MKKITLAVLAFLLFSSHVMYLKLDGYFLEPNASATIQLYNGTFEQSQNVIDRDRMLDVSLMGNGQRFKVDDSQWTEKDSVTLLNFQTGEPGTWVAGVSTAPRSITMDAEAFNSYLEHEGIFDMLDWRRENDHMDSSAVEKYSKHVKTIFQVGEKRTDDWQKPLGYPIEFVPLDNPYELNTGDSLRAQLLFNGKPLANQLVYAHFKPTGDGHTHDDSTKHGHSHDSKTGQGHTHDDKSEHGHTHDDNTEHGHTHDEKSEHGHTHDDNIEHGHTHDGKSEHGHTHDGETTSHSHDDNSSASDKQQHTHKDGTHSHDDDSKAEDKQQHTHKDGTTHSHDDESKATEEAPETHSHTAGQQLRTDANGVVAADLTADGIWYVQTIHLVPTDEADYTHESNWTTLTFEVVHGHGPDSHTHDHDEEEGLPAYVYWIGSLLLIGALFFWFNRKN